MTQTAREQLLATFEEKKAAGLKDMKFFFGNVTESTVDEVCADVNKLYAEVAKGNVKAVEAFGDSNRPR
jgi:hypothetical protein